MFVLCVDLRTNSHYFPIQHSLTGLYNRDGLCLLRGTDWVFIYNSVFWPYSDVFCVDLRTNSDLFPVQRWLTGFVTETECLLRGTDWIFSYSGYHMYYQFNIHNSTFSPHSVFMCFVWIWEQTAIISLYRIKWLVCITETECVYCAVRTECLCYVWISEQTAIISLYNINWLVFITETECVYCAVRTGSLYIILCSDHTVMCFVWISEQTAIFPLYSTTGWLL